MKESALIDAFASWYSNAYEDMAEEAREFLRELKAEAWEEGAQQGFDDCENGIEEFTNPYRGGQ